MTSIGPKQYVFRTDPLDLSARYVVLSPSDGYLRVPFANVNLPPINVWDLRAAKAYLRERGRAAQDEATLFAGYDEMRRIEDAAVASTKVRRNAERRAQTERVHAGTSAATRHTPAHTDRTETAVHRAEPMAERTPESAARTTADMNVSTDETSPDIPHHAPTRVPGCASAEDGAHLSATLEEAAARGRIVPFDEIESAAVPFPVRP